MNRAERRRNERAARRHRPVIIGEGMVAASIGETFSADVERVAELPPKREGQHRWVAAASYVLDMPDRLIGDEGTRKLLGPERLMYLGVGCWDCERAWGEVNGQPCPAEAAPES